MNAKLSVSRIEPSHPKTKYVQGFARSFSLQATGDACVSDCGRVFSHGTLVPAYPIRRHWWDEPLADSCMWLSRKPLVAGETNQEQLGTNR
jgi:hypothetical protein